MSFRKLVQSTYPPCQILHLTNLKHAVNIVERDILRRPAPAQQPHTASNSLNPTSREERYTQRSSIPSLNSQNDGLNCVATAQTGACEIGCETNNGTFMKCGLNDSHSTMSELSGRLSDMSTTFGLVDGIETSPSCVREGNTSSRVGEPECGQRDLSARSDYDSSVEQQSLNITEQVIRGWASVSSAENSLNRAQITNMPAVKR